MASTVQMYKYTGKGGAETAVLSLGFKRVDSAVPSPGGAPVDDRSDAIFYQVYTPDGPNVKTYSYELWIRLGVTVKPDNQISNVRMYVQGDAYEDVHAPKYYVGLAQHFRKPSNAKSTIAETSIWQYSKENPLRISKGGLSGYSIPGVMQNLYSMNVTIGDIGSGNRFYIQGNRQAKLIMFAHQTYVFTNRDGLRMPFSFYRYDSATMTYVPVTAGVSISNPGTNNEVVTVNVDAMIAAGYQTLNYGAAVGGDVLLFDPARVVPDYTVTWDVRAVDGMWEVDGIRAYEFTMLPNNKYIFNNRSGATHPFRFARNSLGQDDDNVLVNGVKVFNAGTNDERIEVNSQELYAFGAPDIFYMCPNHPGMEVHVKWPRNTAEYNLPPFEIPTGAYNLRNVGDKTDFVVLQMEVDQNTTPGDWLPPLVFEWDEC